MNTKNTGIIAYITWIGLIIAYSAGDREGAKFHINQALVLYLAGIICSIISYIPYVGIVGGAASLVVGVFWIMGLVYACKQEEKELPLIGKIKILK